MEEGQIPNIYSLSVLLLTFLFIPEVSVFGWLSQKE